MTLAEQLGARGQELKAIGETAQFYGMPAVNMTRDELLIAIGVLCDSQVFQGEQLAQAAKNIQTLTDELSGGTK